MRTLNRLSDREVKTKTGAGRYADGGGLYLQVGPTGSKSWVFMWVLDGKRTVMGLGAYPTISLADARDKAVTARRLIAAGRDPLAESRRAEEPTFAEAVQLFLADNEGAWKNPKHRAQWPMTLGPAYCRSLQSMKVSAIGTEHVLSVLRPIWLKKAETASRIQGRLERVLAFAKVNGWRSGENPAAWKGHLDALLPPQPKFSRGHHAALPYIEVPAFVERLRGIEAMAARALEFLILTATRSGEVLGARWAEIDLDNAVWTIPSARMKAGRAHEVPLSPRAVSILNELAKTRQSEFVFPGQLKGKPLSSSAMEMLLRRMKAKGKATVHGFRSSFRDWAGDCTDYPREVAEAALAHTLQGVEAAYRRGTALEKRRTLMTAWGEYVVHGRAATILPFPGQLKRI